MATATSVLVAVRGGVSASCHPGAPRSPSCGRKRPLYGRRGPRLTSTPRADNQSPSNNSGLAKLVGPQMKQCCALASWSWSPPAVGPGIRVHCPRFSDLGAGSPLELHLPHLIGDSSPSAGRHTLPARMTLEVAISAISARIERVTLTPPHPPNDSTARRLNDELRRPQGANSRRHGGRVELTSHVGQGAADIAPLSGPHGAAAAHPALCRQHVADPARRR